MLTGLKFHDPNDLQYMLIIYLFVELDASVIVRLGLKNARIRFDLKEIVIISLAKKLFVFWYLIEGFVFNFF